MLKIIEKTEITEKSGSEVVQHQDEVGCRWWGLPQGAQSVGPLRTVSSALRTVAGVGFDSEHPGDGKSVHLGMEGSSPRERVEPCLSHTRPMPYSVHWCL